MFTNDQIFKIADELNIDFSNFTFDDLKRGISIELEHGLVNPFTNVTNDDLEKTIKIALAHLHEFPNYYNKDYGLLVFEKMLKEKLKENV